MTNQGYVKSTFPGAHCQRIPGVGGGYIILCTEKPFLSIDESPVLGFGKTARAAWRMSEKRVRYLRGDPK